MDPMGARDRKWEELARRMNLLAIGIHASLAGVFALVGVPWLVAYSVGAVAFFLAFRLWAPRLSSVGAVSAVTIEANVHVALVALALGPEAGFQLFCFLLAVVPVVAFRLEQAKLRRLFAVLPSVGFALVHVPGPQHAIRVALDPGVLRALYGVDAAGVFISLLLIGAWFTGESERAEGEIADGRARIEELLVRVLPASVARRLIAGKGPIAEAHPSVTVLFADLAGFTTFAAERPPEEVVSLLETVFRRFDELAERHGVEKIKTIGDAYMAAAGVPEPRGDHARVMAQLAIDMLAATEALRRDNGLPVSLRVGLHTGPLVAGVIGERRFLYDLWGDTVNTASRMESHGVAGSVQLTRSTRDALGPGWRTEPRGVVNVKGKGEMETWLLLGREAVAG